MQLAPNRVAVYLTVGASLMGGLAPVVGDLDLTSTAGIVAGLVGIGAVVNKWLGGWQEHEFRTVSRAEQIADRAYHDEKLAPPRLMSPPSTPPAS